MALSDISIYYSAMKMIGKTRYQVERATPQDTALTLKLETVFKVHASEDYLVNYGIDNPRLHVMIRTREGEGFVECTDGSLFYPGRNSLILLRMSDIAKFGTKVAFWRFWWFEFEMMGNPGITEKKLFTLPFLRSEKKRLDESLACLRGHRQTDRHKASSRLLNLILDYSSKINTAPFQLSSQEQNIERVIRQMRMMLEGHLTVPDMARMASLSERRFRDVFFKYCGRSPKNYYEHLRLSRAADLIRFENKTVKETAALLGFSSEFHLSKVFKKQFQVSPSSLKPD